MRWISFFVLSLSLHAAALVYPVSFGGRSHVEIMQVTILPMEQEGEGAGSQRGNGIPARRGASKSYRATSPALEPRLESHAPANPKSQDSSATAVATVGDSIAAVSAVANFANIGGAISGPTGNDANGSGTGGPGNGNGSGSSGAGIALMQARYRDTPRPDYPESARREGREGRVVLRVLIDNQGKTKSVELNTSSGSKVLDQAATEAIKRWRFYPAHAGDVPVDSWVNVPIDFRLTDTRN
jgi:periplasmic protein TonB